ncbi:hypothetical protein U1Q18_034476 [Sarracenia purpurea var. burkii]
MSPFVIRWICEPLWADSPIIGPRDGVAVVELVFLGDLSLHQAGRNSSPIPLGSTTRLGWFPKSLLGSRGRDVPENDLQLPCR